jgi:hypothetical protein
LAPSSFFDAHSTQPANTLPSSGNTIGHNTALSSSDGHLHSLDITTHISR